MVLTCCARCEKFNNISRMVAVLEEGVALVVCVGCTFNHEVKHDFEVCTSEHMSGEHDDYS